MTAPRPTNGFCELFAEVGVFFADRLVGCSWTKATPINRMKSEIHFNRFNLRPSIATEKIAVVRILSWYVT